MDQRGGPSVGCIILQDKTVKLQIYKIFYIQTTVDSFCVDLSHVSMKKKNHLVRAGEDYWEFRLWE